MNEYGSPDSLRHEPGAPVPVLHRRTVDVVAGMGASVCAAAAGIVGAIVLTPPVPFLGAVSALAGVAGAVIALKIGLGEDETSPVRSGPSPVQSVLNQSERDRIFRMLDAGKIEAGEAERLLSIAKPDKDVAP